MNTALPKFSLLAVLIKKPLYMIPFLASTVIIAPVINIYGASSVLVVLVFIDAITGTYASYCDWKKLPVKKDKSFFGKSGEGFSSDKLKKMGIKAMVYLFVPLGFVWFQNVFHLKTFRIESISNAEMDVATVLIIGACAMELYSIFKENLPRGGFDLFDRIRKFLGIYKEFKDEN